MRTSRRVLPRRSRARPAKKWTPSCTWRTASSLSRRAAQPKPTPRRLRTMTRTERHRASATSCSTRAMSNSTMSSTCPQPSLWPHDRSAWLPTTRKASSKITLMSQISALKTFNTQILFIIIIIQTSHFRIMRTKLETIDLFIGRTIDEQTSTPVLNLTSLANLRQHPTEPVILKYFVPSLKKRSQIEWSFGHWVISDHWLSLPVFRSSPPVPQSRFVNTNKVNNFEVTRVTSSFVPQAFY